MTYLKPIFMLLMLLCGMPLAAQEKTGYEIALERIEKARASGATVLDLSKLGLAELPPEIGLLYHLEDLRLDLNQLSRLPPHIDQLVNPRYLRLYHNQLSQLPPEIGQLHQLCYLDITYNRLRDLPSELAKILTPSETCSKPSLYLVGNPLITPPPEVIAQGTPTVLAYLREQAWYHTRQLLLSAAGGVGILASVVLFARWRYRRMRKPKKKNEV
jgi:hypothetical protein